MSGAAVLNYSSAAVPTTLSSALSSVTPGSTGTVEVASITGMPTSYPFTLIAEWDTSNAEVITVTQAATGTGPYSFANSVRGSDGTSAPAHSSGASITHGVSVRDFAGQAVTTGTGTYTGLGKMLGNSVLLAPSGDDTGASDPANIAALFTLGATTVELAAGTWYGDSTVQIGLSQAVHGAGTTAVTWNYLGADQAFQLENSGTYSASEWAELTGLTVDGTNASAGAIGVQFGDIAQLRIDVDVRNFSGTGSIGLYACNAYNWTEQATVRSFINNCTTGCELDVTGNGTNSFLRSRFDLYFNQGPDQDGLVIAGTSTEVALTEGVVRLHGNWAEGSSATGSVLSFTNSSSWIEACQIDIGVEPGASGSGGAFVQTINFTSEDATQIINCYGVMQFDNSFTASNNHANIWFDGPIYGDNSLLSLQAHPEVYEGYSSGYPTGWSGDVFFACPRGDGRVDFHVELTIASGTVVTAGETILSGLPSWAYYTGETRYVVVTLDYSGHTPVVLAISSGGDLLYEGTGFTVSGTAYLTGGVAQYSNGYY